MENTTRALVMAGGILIGILILGALMLLINSLGSYQTQKYDSNKTTEIARFNNSFEPYNKDNLSLMELKSVYNKINDNNNKNPEYKIDSNFLDEQTAKEQLNKDADKYGGQEENVYDKFIKNFRNISEEQKMKHKFKCKNIQYNNPGGRISSMDFYSK